MTMRPATRIGGGFGALIVMAASCGTGMAKPEAQEAFKVLKDGNQRFQSGQMTHLKSDKPQRDLAAKSDQGDYAIATVVSCSDSRVPVETVFDMGIMDVFVVRVAGNVLAADEIGSVEYGVCHVKTPVLLVLGHSKCGAVTAVAKGVKGEGHALEKNIPPLVHNIEPAVHKVLEAFPQCTLDNLVPRAIEANVWQGIKNVLLRSAAIREKAHAGQVKVVGGVYELETVAVKWLPEEQCAELLRQADADPTRETEVMAAGGGHQAVAVAKAAKEEAPPRH